LRRSAQFIAVSEQSTRQFYSGLQVAVEGMPIVRGVF